MAIIGAHSILYTSEPDAVRAIFRDVFEWRTVDAGDGWLIFALPPAELGIHPTDADATPHHELALMCDDLEATKAELRNRGVAISDDTVDAGWGITTTITLPGDLEVMLYQPRHPTAIQR